MYLQYVCMKFYLQMYSYSKLDSIYCTAEYYPKDFSVDANGKKNSWECIVQIPFIEVGIAYMYVHTYIHTYIQYVRICVIISHALYVGVEAYKCCEWHRPLESFDRIGKAAKRSWYE